MQLNRNLKLIFFILLIEKDLLKQRHAKITERFKAQRFGVILTPSSREKNQFFL